jgi:O-antigen/teichoic acid export membrane protein
VEILRIQGIGLLTAFLLATWLFALLSLKLFRQLLIVNTVGAIVSIAGTLALAPELGGKGAAIAIVSAEAVLAVGCLIAMSRARRALRPNLIIVPKVAVAIAVALVPALLLDVHPVIEVALSSVVYGVVLLALRGVPPELIKALLGRDPGRVS